MHNCINEKLLLLMKMTLPVFYTYHNYQDVRGCNFSFRSREGCQKIMYDVRGGGMNKKAYKRISSATPSPSAVYS